MTLRVQAAGISDRGLKRGHNEDSLSVVTDLGLFIVADGMGGHNAGEVASRQSIESIVEYLRSVREDPNTEPPRDEEMTIDESIITAAIKKANRDVCNLSLEHQEYSGMGTTMVAAIAQPDASDITIGHVGDSRCYLLRSGEISQLTLDHSWVSEQLQKNIITEEEAKNHRWKNVITRALGNKPEVDVDVQTHKVEPYDVYLLCSDGLCGMVEDEQMKEILQNQADLDQALRDLIKAANSNGGIDNITCVLIRFLPQED